MNVTLFDELPEQWKHTKPLRTYETRMLYIGFRRYNVEQKTISTIILADDGSVHYEESPFESAVFSRGYACEQVRVTVYSDSPRVWVEALSPYERTVFVQQPQQTAFT
jgi:hypothetical protein